MGDPRERTYLDHAASAPMVPEALLAMTAELGRAGNPASLHSSGRWARRVLEDARDQVAEVLGAHPSEVIFTSGGTEADNLAVQGSWRARPVGLIGRRDRLVRSSVEHPAVADTMDALTADGADVQLCGVYADGVLRLDALAALLEVATMLVSVLWTNNETGTTQSIVDVVAEGHRGGAWVHSDAVQAVGHLPIDFAASELDLMSLSAHKFGGPVGIGALLARRELPLQAYAFGGGQERALRSGTQPAALAAGFAAALQRASTGLADEARRLHALSDRLRFAAANWGGVINGRPDSPAIVNVSFPGARADDLLMLLDSAGIDCSTGSACTAGVHQPSPVLLAMGHDQAQARESLRFSLGWNTTAADLERLVAALPDAVHRARLAGRVGR